MSKLILNDERCGNYSTYVILDRFSNHSFVLSSEPTNDLEWLDILVDLMVEDIKKGLCSDEEPEDEREKAMRWVRIAGSYNKCVRFYNLSGKQILGPILSSELMKKVYVMAKCKTLHEIEANIFC